MELIHRIGFFIDYSRHREVEHFFRQYNIEVETPEKGRYTSDIRYLVPIKIDNSMDLNKLKEIYNKLDEQLHIPNVGEAIFFHFSDQDFERSLIFQLTSTGNSQQAILSEKGKIQWRIFCPKCELKFKEQDSPLVINTGKMKNRYMVNVDTDYWVASEKMVALMEEWKITGYDLKEVIHKGPEKDKQPAYQIIPTNVLPPWSSEMKHHYFIDDDEQRWICEVCGIRGKINYPFHYNRSDLEGRIQDVNILNEWGINGHANGWAYKPVLFSKRFRDLLIEHKITRDVRDMYAKNYGSKDWFFKPTIIID